MTFGSGDQRSIQLSYGREAALCTPLEGGVKAGWLPSADDVATDRAVLVFGQDPFPARRVRSGPQAGWLPPSPSPPQHALTIRQGYLYDPIGYVPETKPSGFPPSPPPYAS